MRAYLAGGILLMFLIACGVVGGDWYVARVRASADKAGYQRAKGEQAQSDNKALTQALADVRRLQGELQEVSRDARQKTDALAVAQRDAADAGRRLLDAISRFRSKCLAPIPQAPATAGGPPADAAERVLADVQRRLGEAQERTAGFADASRIAGLACERSYDALK